MYKRLLPPTLFYFCWFTALGFYMPYVGLYYRAAGLDLAKIGLLVALPGLLQIIATPLWGLVADGLQIHRVLLPLAVAGTLLPVLLTGQTGSFEILLALVAILALFTAPITPLADSATLALLGDQRSRYGALRLWGAVGWGLSTLAAGALVQRLGLWIVFPSYALFGALVIVVALYLPRASLPRVDLRSAAATMVRDLRWARFLSCIFLIGCCNSMNNGFLSLYLQDLGAGGDQIGLAIAIASVSELPVLALSPLVLRRWGAQPLLIGAGLLYALRAGIYAVAPSLGWVLAAQLLHGPCFSALWTGGVDEAQRLAPKGMEVTAQSLFGTLFFGVATAVASAVAGWIYRDLGSGTLFSIGSLAALLGALGMLAGRRAVAKPAPAEIGPTGR
jgi:PPP family 3-phenylpropionic acid transporter